MEEISLRELIDILIKRKKTIIYITTFAVLITGVLNFLVLKPKYEVKMILMTSNISEQFKKTGENLSGSNNVGNILDAISQYPSMDLETYRQQIKTPEVMAKTITDLNLEDEYTVETLSEKISLETVKDTELITIKMQDGDAQKAADIVNKVGENFASVVSDNAKERASKASEHIKEQMEIEKEKYDEALLELKEFLSQPRTAKELELEMDAKLEQITQFKTRLNELDIRKDALESAVGIAGTNSSRINIQPMENSPQTMNIVSGDAKNMLKIELAEVGKSIESTKQKIIKMQEEIEGLQIELQEKKHKENLIQQKVGIAQATYESFVKKYEELKVAESSKIGEAGITVISKAYASSKPIAPRKTLNVAISLVLGIIIGVFIAFFQEYWQFTDKDMEIVDNK